MRAVWIAVALLGSGMIPAKGDPATTTPAQAPSTEAPAPPKPVQQERVDALQQVLTPLGETASELDRLRKELQRAGNDQAKESLQAQIDAERERIGKLRQNFRDIIGGAEAAEYEGAGKVDLSMQDQVVELLQPLVSTLREASETPRELDALRSALAAWQEKQRKASVVLGRITEIEATIKDKALLAEFTSVRRFWEGRRAECSGQIGVLKDQIRERELKRRPVWEVISAVVSDFFRSRGLNLFIALITSIFAYVAVVRIYGKLRRYSPVHRGGRSLTSRLSDILARLLAVLAAIWAVVLVFYIRGDWLLLTVVALLLIGLAWAGKESLPPYIEQIRTVLNLGSIREGERIIHNGLPWKVNALGYLSSFENPDLQGGEVKLPIRDVIKMVSRDADDREPWFPTRIDDWVLMPDGVYGKVVTQTPEQVVVLRQGGSLKTYPSAAFLEACPENLSRGFRITSVFGIDYRHQAISTSQVPEILTQALTTVLVGEYGRESIHSIKVEFAHAGASSLDYQILVDADGSMAGRYQVLQRLIQKVCVDTCNAENWVIPFQQITVHNA